ncbi:hypothetical protein [Streptomyces sp. NPDC005438]|uniref:hypothetical protein n=1 Tax=Streptomyces sp. NPDC005438 TaxID=3156880 RepID=UPI0033B9AED8
MDAQQSPPVSANLRLLPWTDTAGRPCYLKEGGTRGHVSRKADHVEAEQIDNGRECLEYANEILAEPEPDEEELLFLVEPLRDALRDLLRIAKSRGDRIPWHDPYDHGGAPEHQDGPLNGTHEQDAPGREQQDPATN